MHKDCKSVGILGNLEITNTHKARLSELFGKILISDGKKVTEAEDIIAQCSYIISCNFNLNSYLHLLEGCNLVILAETGIVNLDISKAQKYKIRYTNIPTYAKSSVVEYVLRCILEQIRPWKDIFSEHSKKPIPSILGNNIEEKTFGIVGLGNIGKAIATHLTGLGGKVNFYSRQKENYGNVMWVSMEELFKNSDFIVISLSLNQESKAIINSNIMKLSKFSSTVISISPEEVFVKEDLYRWIDSRSDMNFWMDLDITEQNNTLRKYTNAHISPHSAFYTRKPLENRIEECIGKLEAFLKIH